MSGPHCRILSQVADCAFFVLLSRWSVSSRLPHTPSFYVWSLGITVMPRSQDKREGRGAQGLCSASPWWSSGLHSSESCWVTLITLASVSFTHVFSTLLMPLLSKELLQKRFSQNEWSFINLVGTRIVYVFFICVLKSHVLERWLFWKKGTSGREKIWGQKEDSKGERDKVCYMKFYYENVIIKLVVLYN